MTCGGLHRIATFDTAPEFARVRREAAERIERFLRRP